MKKMKQYLLFGGDYYHPVGGMNDFIDSFDTLQEAVDRANSPKVVYGSGEFAVKVYYDWTNVVDTETGLIYHPHKREK